MSCLFIRIRHAFIKMSLSLSRKMRQRFPLPHPDFRFSFIAQDPRADLETMSQNNPREKLDLSLTKIAIIYYRIYYSRLIYYSRFFMLSTLK